MTCRISRFLSRILAADSVLKMTIIKWRMMIVILKMIIIEWQMTIVAAKNPLPGEIRALFPEVERSCCKFELSFDLFSNPARLPESYQFSVGF